MPRAYRGTITATIVDKERITYTENGKTESKYLIYTEDEVLENTDEPFYFKFNSSDLYGMLKQGETYELTVAGWRIKLFSKYRNIISATRQVELPSEKEEEEPELRPAPAPEKDSFEFEEEPDVLPEDIEDPQVEDSTIMVI